MTLTTHAVVGATIASALPSHPLLGFVLAFSSHFLLDAIPHWDYALSSHKSDGSNRMNDDMMIDKVFFTDLMKIGFDMLCGVLIVILVFTLHGPHILWLPLVGVAGATLPDALQFAYWKYRHQPLISLQRFHIWVHAKKDFNKRPFLGITFQIIVVALSISISIFSLC
jgi:hypothetical protein